MTPRSRSDLHRSIDRRAASRRAAILVGLLGAVAGTTLAEDEGLSTAIVGGTVHTLAGPPIAAGTVLIRGERIEAAGAGVGIPDDARRIDAAGLHVYPGIFDAFSRLGLTEVGSVSATEDMEELGDFNPELLAAAAVHPASEHIPVARANGVTHAVTAPGSGGVGFFGFGGFGGGVLAGQATLLHLAGWTVEEMAILPSVGLILNWPSIQTRSFDFATFSIKEKPFTEAKKEHDEAVAELADWIEAAKHYAQAAAAGSTARYRRDLKLEALLPVLRGELPVLLMANAKRDIENGIDFCEQHGLRVILAGGGEAWKAKDLLAEKGVPVILRPTLALPSDEDQPYDKPLTAPGELAAAGVKIAFASFSSANSRLLPYEAANAVPYGLPREEALRAITLYPAEILGVDDRLGTIEAGKTANLIVTDGDPLEIPTQVMRLFIRGRETSTDNRHRRLYELHRSRP